MGELTSCKTFSKEILKGEKYFAAKNLINSKQIDSCKYHLPFKASY
jgi:hypothetical protein